MYSKTHVVFSVLVSLFVLDYVKANPYIFISVAFIAAMVPDIDTRKSFLGSIVVLPGLLLKHRGILHSVVFAIFLLVLAPFINSVYYLAFVVGYASHIFLDLLNKEGVEVFYPVSKKMSHGFIKSGGIIEKAMLFGIVALIVYKLIS